MRIWLVRHGESLGNVDEAAWSKIPDHLIPLTEFGLDQAKNAGEKISQYYKDHEELKDKKVRLWYSPYLRTVQTKQGLAKGLGNDLIANFNQRGEPGWEDDRLREQDFGMFSPIYSKEEQFKHYPLEAKHFYNIQDHKGRYWAKAPMGESRADVCLRVGESIDTLMRDKQTGKEDFVFVTHGVTMRAFIKRFMNYDIEWFENERNPHNCDVVLIESNKEGRGVDGRNWTVTKMFSGLKRKEISPHVPKDYKIGPVDGYDSLKEQFGYEPSVRGRT